MRANLRSQHEPMSERVWQAYAPDAAQISEGADETRHDAIVSRVDMRHEREVCAIRRLAEDGKLIHVSIRQSPAQQAENNERER